TEAGTYMVKDIDSNGSESSDPEYLAVVGGTLFFSAYDGPQGGGTHDRELWKSNGTEAGTQMVEDINTSAYSEPRYMTNVGGTLFFSADDGTHGGERGESTDGTGANTDLGADIKASAGSYPNHLTNVGGTLFFSANDGPEPAQDGVELWRSTDGTAPNTGLVEDINATGSGSPEKLTNVGGTLFFTAFDGVQG